MVQVSQIIIHPTYRSEGSSGDIALLKLQNPIEYSDYILPVCIPNPNVVFPTDLNCYVTGWGSIRSGVSLPSPQTLQQVQIPIIDRGTCDNMYHTNNPSTAATTTLIQWDMICAGFKDGGKDSCQGDSGGPLVCSSGGTWVLAGIVSWGFSCAVPYRPGVYTLVTAYLQWIQQYIPNVQLTLANYTVTSPPSTNGYETASPSLTLLLLLIPLLLHKLL
ncbi:prostasin-like [Bombina bombina]|uniref:prostasin-like n=1 Tax=Bombina bombina TaxID=8345 RepID=UPI00235AD283|nr:prostasin-like [Bombina bombina]